MRQVGHLKELTEKYYDKGFRIIAVSKEGTSLLESKMIKDKEANYWIASDPSGSTMKRFTRPGRIGIPHAYLVDATGTVVSEGFPNDQQIENLLEAVFTPELDRELNPALKSVVRTYGKGQIGKAWTAAAKFLENEDRAISSDAAYVREKAEAYAKYAQGLVESSIKGKDYNTAYGDLAAMAKRFAGMPVVSWSKDKKKALDGDAAVKNEMKAWKSLEKAMKVEEKAGGKAKKLGPAIKKYRSVVKKYAGTRAADTAEKALKRLGG